MKIIKKILGKKYDLPKNEELELKNAIHYFLSENNSSMLLQTITDINFLTDKENIYIQIKTHTPGLLIGKHGSFVKKLNYFLKSESNKDIKIDIKDSDIWKNIYS
jgi:ribosomal protein S3